MEILLSLLVALGPTSTDPAVAQEVLPPPADRYEALVEDLAACARIPGPTERLAAYDALATRLGVGPKPVLGAGKWVVKTSLSPIDDSTTVIVSLPAEEDSTARLKQGQLPQLVLRCKKGAFDVYSIVGTPPEPEGTDPKATVTLRYGKEPAIEVKMDRSVDGDALFWPDAEANIGRMLRAERLLLAYVPATGGTALVTFDLRGLAHVHPQLALACAEGK